MSSIDPDLRIGSVTLAVGDLDRSADFYERLLGLPRLAAGEDSASFGWDPAAPVLVLEQIARPVALPPHATGLYHVAWLHPSRADLAATVRRIAQGGWPLEGAADHGVSEALYLSDPDGLGIEIYSDRPRESWGRPPGGHGVQMVTLPLDLEGLLAESTGEPTERMPAATAVGHVHLKASDVPRTSAFYRDTLGLQEMARLPSASFLSAGGYHHHVGLNSWQSAGAAPAPEGAPALTRVQFELGSQEQLDALAQRLRAAGAGADAREQHELAVRDPDGELLAFSVG